MILANGCNITKSERGGLNTFRTHCIHIYIYMYAIKNYFKYNYVQVCNQIFKYCIVNNINLTEITSAQPKYIVINQNI